MPAFLSDETSLKGILFNLIEDVVCEHLGVQTWEDVVDGAGVDHAYTALGTYPDAEAMALVASAALMLDLTARDTLVWVGKGATAHFYKRYPEYFEPYTCAQDFLPALNTIIHPDVRKLDPEARPPSFDCRATGSQTMEVIYESHRPMCGLAEGLMHGVARHYGQQLEISHRHCVERGDARCLFDLKFRPSDP